MNFENIKKINVDISEKNGKIYCKVSMPARSSNFRTRVDITTPAVRALLSRKGYNTAPLVELQGTYLSNKSSAGPLGGTWVFEYKKERPVHRDL